MHIVPEPGRALDLAAIAPALWREGLRALRVQVVADGAREGDGRFRIAGWPDAFAFTGTLDEGRARIRANVRIVDGEPRLRLVAKL